MKLKRFTAALLVLLLMAGCAADALAAAYNGPGPGDQGAEYLGPSGPAPDGRFPFVDVQVYTSNGKSIQDFFGPAGKNLMPGDQRIINVRLTNQSSRPATFYMKAAARLTGGYVPGQGGSDFYDDFDNTGQSTKLEPLFPGKTAYDPLLEATKVTMSYDGTVFYRGDLRGTSDSGASAPYMVSWHGLGTVPPGQTRLIVVTLSLDANIGNEYADRLAAVDWIFMATEDDSTSRPSPSPTPSEPPEEISPAPPPVEPPPEETPTPSPGGGGDEIIDLVVPPAKPPKTGDDQVLSLWILMLAVSLFGIIILLLKSDRDDKKEQKANIPNQEPL